MLQREITIYVSLRLLGNVRSSFWYKQNRSNVKRSGAAAKVSRAVTVLGLAVAPDICLWNAACQACRATRNSTVEKCLF